MGEAVALQGKAGKLTRDTCEERAPWHTCLFCSLVNLCGLKWCLASHRGLQTLIECPREGGRRSIKPSEKAGSDTLKLWRGSEALEQQKSLYVQFIQANATASVLVGFMVCCCDLEVTIKTH